MIKMDFGQIGKAGGYPIGAAVLGHELAHAAQNTKHGPARTLESLSMRERQAYRVGGWVMHGLGWSSPVLPDLADGNFEESINNAARTNCIKSANDYEDAHGKRPLLPGNCK